MIFSDIHPTLPSRLLTGWICPGLVARHVCDMAAPLPDEDPAAWKLFTELDLHEENEMLELSVFLSTLQESFEGSSPGSKRHLATVEFLDSEADHDDDDVLATATAAASISRSSMSSGGRPTLGSMSEVKPRHSSIIGTDQIADGIKVHRGASFTAGEQLNDFALPKGNVTMQTAERVVEVYRRGGRLSLKASDVCCFLHACRVGMGGLVASAHVAAEPRHALM